MFSACHYAEWDSEKDHMPEVVTMDEEPGGDDKFAAFTTGTATSRGGRISVTTTELGLPLALSVVADQLQRDPAELADDLLALCRQAANRAGLARRQELAEQGVSSSGLDLLKLPKPEEVQREEIAYETEHEYEPRSWLEQGY
jgi:hypothetical protein